jgi:hypothetical protein
MPAQLGTFVVPVLASAPSVGAEGAMYYNSTSDVMYVSTGAAWTSVGGAGGVTLSDTAPVAPTTGQLWLNTATLALAVYYDAQWLEAGQGSSAPVTVSSSGGSDIGMTLFYE